MKEIIGIFDSGLGGLSVLRELYRAIPDASYIYYSDSAFCPYGDKPAENIRERACEISSLLLSKGAEAIVVACNTATSAAIKHLRETFSVPFIGMEPAIKPAALGTKSGVIGVLATYGTLCGVKYLDIKSRYVSNVKVVERVGRGFVELVENMELEGERAEKICLESLQPLLDEGADRIVLGCTHYPFLLPLMEELVGRMNLPQGRPEFINPAPAVARHTAEVLGVEAKNAAGVFPETEFLCSGNEANLEKCRELILR